MQSPPARNISNVDALLERLLLLVKGNALFAPLALLWLLRGPVFFRAQIDRRCAALPSLPASVASGSSGLAPGGVGRIWITALRLHQWAKNLLIFVPAIAAHRILEPATAVSVALAFLWFGLCASGTYLINDLLDLDADRAHSRKRLRPFASGQLRIVHGLLAGPALIGASLIGATLTVGPLFAWIMTAYLAATLWYSTTLKQIAMVDVLALAALYTLRLLAGAAAAKVSPSFWLLAFSMFLFLGLAIIKRYTELRSLLAVGGSQAGGRGYTTEDLPLLLSCGTSSCLISVLVLALYVNDGTRDQYRHPELLWLLCPLVLYWVIRIWRVTFRGQLDDDPVVFALRDRQSLLVGALSIGLVWLAI